MEGTKKIKSTSFHQYSWNSEVETTWISLIGWHHKTSIIYLFCMKIEYTYLPTGCLISKRHNVNSIYRVFEIKMCQIKGICMFIGNGHLTVDPWIWLKVTSLSSTASVLKDGRISLEITSIWSKICFFKTSK